MKIRSWLTAVVFAIATASSARAEVSEVVVAKQFGIAFLHITMMEEFKLIEKHARALGVSDLKVRYQQLASSSAMTDALLSGDLHVVSGGIPAFLLLWDKTNGAMRSFGALNALNQYLLTNNPAIKSIKDFTEKDRIALPAVKLSGQAIALQMAAAKAFGESEYAKLDHLTISRSHPDAIAQLLSRNTELTGHFSAPPFQDGELRNPGIFKVMTVYDVIGPNTSSIVYATAKFTQENPKISQAIVEALAEATQILKTDTRAMAELYIKINKGQDTVDQIVALLQNPETEITMVPKGMLKYADFMQKIGLIKKKPASVQDVFLPFAGLENGN